MMNIRIIGRKEPTEGIVSRLFNAANKGVYHYRLFCDEAWKPIMPRGEVYSTQFTERGWKSFSDLHKL